jgi:glycosyltransferase involved in cell wall biosynthesis
VAYSEEEIRPLTDGETPILLYVGRFTKVKRVPLMIRAFARARAGGARGALVLVGGHPGEWEGEHPLDVVRETGAPDVFLAGWHGHEELPAFLNAADAIVLASVREQFGQVLVEAMAAELPAVAVDAFGPGEIVADGTTGWLVPPDDEAALAGALEDVLTRPDERRRRGLEAARAVSALYAWPAIAGRLADVFDQA